MFCPEEIELSGAEVRLRPMRIEDIDALALAAQEDRQHYLFNWVPDSVADTRAYVDRALAARDAGQRFPFVVEWQGRIVGTTSYSNYQPWQWGKHGADKQRDTPDVVEIGSTWWQPRPSEPGVTLKPSTCFLATRLRSGRYTGSRCEPTRETADPDLPLSGLAPPLKEFGAQTFLAGMAQ